jgi:hypothetical protein
MERRKDHFLGVPITLWITILGGIVSLVATFTTLKADVKYEKESRLQGQETLKDDCKRIERKIDRITDILMKLK